MQSTDLEKMPPAMQQTAIRVLPKDTLRQLQGAAMASAMEKSLMELLNRRMAKDKDAQKVIGQINDAGNQMQKDAAATAPGDFRSAAAYTEPVERGTWAQLPGGFYVRYLPDGFMKTRLQVIVPDAAIAALDPKTPLTFDPTQYIAILGSAPGERLGITLRPAR